MGQLNSVNRGEALRIRNSTTKRIHCSSGMQSEGSCHHQHNDGADNPIIIIIIIIIYYNYHYY